MSFLSEIKEKAYAATIGKVETAAEAEYKANSKEAAYYEKLAKAAKIAACVCGALALLTMIGVIVASHVHGHALHMEPGATTLVPGGTHIVNGVTLPGHYETGLIQVGMAKKIKAGKAIAGCTLSMLGFAALGPYLGYKSYKNHIKAGLANSQE